MDASDKLSPRYRSVSYRDGWYVEDAEAKLYLTGFTLEHSEYVAKRLNVGSRRLEDIGPWLPLGYYPVDFERK